MNTAKEQAFKLRKQGYSYNEISHRLDIAKSTLSAWLHGMALSSHARERLAQRVNKNTLRTLVRRNKQQTHLALQRMRVIRAESLREIKTISKQELKCIGIALYWAEGYKRLQKRNGREVTYHPVSLTNSDPKLIAAFLRFLREICHVPDNKIRIEIRIYQHQNEKNLLKFWKNVTQLPSQNFGKTYYGVSKSSANKRPFNQLPYGTALIRVNDTALFHKIMGWIEGMAIMIGTK